MIDFWVLRTARPSFFAQKEARAEPKRSAYKRTRIVEFDFPAGRSVLRRETTDGPHQIWRREGAFLMATAKDISVAQPAPGNRRLLLGSIGALAIGILAGVGASMLAGASAGAYKTDAINSGDTVWVLTSSALVMLMTPAVGFFYGGMVRSKNVVSVIKQSLVILALISVQWVLFGYSLAFGKDIGGGLLGGLTFFGLKGVGYAPNS